MAHFQVSVANVKRRAPQPRSSCLDVEDYRGDLTRDDTLHRSKVPVLN
jgi:hypothetical protein